MVTCLDRSAELYRDADAVLHAVHRQPTGFRAAVDTYLGHLRDALLAEEGEDFGMLARAALEHPVREVFHADPFTYRTFSKPRGYAGDAVMLDYIYGPRFAPLPEMSPLAQQVFLYTTHSQASQAVRHRREVLAAAVDRAALEVGQPITAISIASGHLREAACSRALACGKVRWIAFDQDEESLLVAEKEYGRLGVEVVPGKVRSVLTGSTSLPMADIVYTAGLLDYMETRAAQMLLDRLFDKVQPGGTLLYANFLPAVADCGYMASFMDWHLLTRSTAETLALSDHFDPSQVASRRCWTDDNQNIAYVLVGKRND